MPEAACARPLLIGGAACFFYALPLSAAAGYRKCATGAARDRLQGCPPVSLR